MRMDILFICVLIGSLATIAIAQPTTGPATTQASTDRPNPALSPQDVVRAVCRAMQENNEKDEGIATVFSFASPSNREATGPLERFIPLVKSPAYSPMLNCKSIELGPGETKENVTQQAVKITAVDGTVTIYVFILSKQADGEFKDCWMTDGVMPVAPPANNGPPPEVTERV